MKIKTRIRSKIIMVVIPILLLTSLFIGMTAYLTTQNGITGIAKEFLGYKLNEIYKYAARQNEVLKNMNLTNDQAVLENAKNAVLSYASGTVNSDKGGFAILSTNKTQNISTISNLSAKEIDKIFASIHKKTSGWLEYQSDQNRVGVFIYFSDWHQYFIILQDRESFYKPVTEIVRYLIIILIASSVFSSILLLWYISHITKPINNFVDTIKNITERMDLSNRVKIYDRDEIGYLGFYFNNMISELESAYNQIKNYAYQTVLAKKKEERVRFIFQKYVPTEVINSVLNLSSDSMLIGAEQNVTLLFADIRSFTSISEKLAADELVLALNAYFNDMVSVITKYNGTIDKFIGDAIMAIYGAPVQRASDPENSVRSAIEMIQALEGFNRHQKETGKTPFKIGIGVNTGSAVVGNIGSEQKINYTVIGDTVNLASRLEGLTKKYKTPIIISDFTRSAIPAGKFYYRVVDRVRVKGKNKPVKIFTPFFPGDAEKLMTFFEQYHKALNFYTKGDFVTAQRKFEDLIQQKKDDYLCFIYKERCEYYQANPPETWDGVETWNEK